MENQTTYPRDTSFIDRNCSLVRPDKRGYLYSKHDILNRLSKKLKGSNSWQRKKILEGVYKQLIVSDTGKSAKGEYHDFVQKKDDVTQYLARYVSLELENNGLENHARRLNEQYGIPGKAYAFFDSDASEDYLKEVMQGVVDDPTSPKGLELAVQEGATGLDIDQKLARAIQYPYDYRVMTHDRLMREPEREERPAASLKYSLSIKCPGITNEDAAKKTRNILGYVRTLNDDSDLFRCALVYEKKGEYNLLE